MSGNERSSADRESRLLHLIDRIYAAGFGETGWDEVTRSLWDLLGCSVVVIHADDPEQGESVIVSNPGMDPAEAARYEEYYVRRNPWLARAAPVLRGGAILHGEELIPQDTFRHTEYYNDFARPNGIDRALAVCLHHQSDLIALLSLFKPPGGRRFSTRDVEFVRLLVPHLQRAAAASGTFGRLHAERALAARALDALGRGAVVLDERGRVVFVNRRMEEIVAQEDGVSLRDGTLRLADARARRALERALSRSGVEAVGGALRAARPSLLPDWEIVVTRLPAIEAPPSILAALEGRGGWLVFVTDPDRRPRGPLTGLRRLYGLTDAEAEVATLLYEGRRRREIGEIRGTTLDTVKSQVRAVYRKVDVSSRAELLRRLRGLGLEAGARVRHPNG